MNKSYLFPFLILAFLLSGCFTHKATYSLIKEDGPVLKIENPGFQIKKTPGFYIAPVIIAGGAYYYGSNTQIKNQNGVYEKGGAWVGILSAALAYGLTGEFQKLFAPKPKAPISNPDYYLSKLTLSESRFSRNTFLQASGNSIFLFNRPLPITSIEQIEHLQKLTNPIIIDEVIGVSLNQDNWILENILTTFPSTHHKKNLLTNWTKTTANFNQVLSFRNKYPGNDVFEPKAFTLITTLNETGKYLQNFPQSAKKVELEKTMLYKMNTKEDVEKYMALFPKSSYITEKYGTIRVGTLINGELNGRGALIYGGTNSTYVGDFRNDKINGEGNRYKNGNVYSGKFIGNSLNGKGSAWYNNGDSYTGHFKDDEPDGYGEYNWSNGAWYKGMFKEGEKNGQGEYRTKDGYRFTGNFVNDKRQGKFKVEKWTLLGLLGDEWVVEYDNDKVINQNQTKSDFTDFITGKTAREARIRERSEKSEKCDKCEVDRTRTTSPDENSFLGMTFDKPGKIYMKNGDEYEYYYSQDKNSWLVKTGLFKFDEKFKKFEEMLNYFVAECKEEYCK
jgi:hypothetical protein